MKLFTSFALAAAMVASASSISAQDRADLLWVLGDATPYGWSCDDATALVAPEGSKTYTGTMYLEADKIFKFLTKYDFGNEEYRAAQENATPGADGKVALVLTKDGNDYQIHVTESANYQITVDGDALEATIVKSAYQETHVNFASLFIVGDVLSTGYSVDNGLVMVQNPALPVEYSVSGAELLPGKFKIATVLKGAGTWDGKYWYFRDADNDAKMVLNQDGDIQWAIAEGGKYDIKANVATGDITIAKTDQSGIDVVAADTAAGEAVYYTIDGRKVASPAAGTLVIKVAADGTASKIRF